MKKIAVFVVLMFMLTSALISSEVSFFYTSQSHQRYWHYTDNGIRFDWYKSNYGIDLNVTPLLVQQAMQVNEAWIKFGGKSFGVKAGMMWYPFGNVETVPSKNVSILQPMNFDSAVMLNFCGMVGDLKWQAYWADAGFINWARNYDAPSYIGARLSYAMDDLKVGASFRGKNLLSGINPSGDTDYANVGKIYEYGADVCWFISKMVKLNVQAFKTQFDPTKKDTRIHFFGILSYEKGFDLPVVKKTVPYAGYFSKDGYKEYNFVAGLNMKPMDNVFMKLEYNHDSVDGVGDTITLQAGYVF